MKSKQIRNKEESIKRKTSGPKSKPRSKTTAMARRPEVKHHPIIRLLFLVAAFVILSFNLFVKVNVQAQNDSQAISIENLLTEHNKLRQAEGLPLLKLNTLLNKSASEKAQAMLDSNCWSHYCPNGKSPWDFFDDVKYNYTFAGENLAEGFYNINDLMTAWMNSPTHKENILKPQFNEVGFAILEGNYLNNNDNVLVVVHFGSRASKVTDDTTKDIQITSPIDGSKTDQSSLDVTGTISGFSRVSVFDNNTMKGDGLIDNGIFTYRLQNLSEGKNTLFAEGISDDLTLLTNKVEVTYSPKQFVQASDVNGISISPQDKNLINLIFVLVLAAIFIVDIIIIGRPNNLLNFKSYSHYHLGLILLVGIIIIAGGFAGQIQNGISL